MLGEDQIGATILDARRRPLFLFLLQAVSQTEEKACASLSLPFSLVCLGLLRNSFMHLNSSSSRRRRKRAPHHLLRSKESSQPVCHLSDDVWLTFGFCVRHLLCCALLCSVCLSPADRPSGATLDTLDIVVHSATHFRTRVLLTDRS